VAYTFKHGDRPLDGVTIQRAVGRGGFGEVYYALTDSGKQVALKYLRDNPEVELRGISHVMNLKSPHLITIYDVRRNEQGDPFVVMEYVSGPSLRELLNAEPNGFSPQKAAFLFAGMAKGLAYLHERGIVHRDMKPANIFYDDGYVKIGDYGLSKHIAVSRHSAQTVSVGTVHYMAPEVGSGNYTKAIDIYALGVILFEMLTGRLPFTGASMAEILMRHVNDRPDLAGVPEPFRTVVARALAKEPAGRWQDANEMLDALMNGELSQSVADFDHSRLSHTERDPDALDPDRTLTRSPAPRRAPRVPPPPLDVHNLGSPIPEIPRLPGERAAARRAAREARRGGPLPASSPLGEHDGAGPRRWPQILTLLLAGLAVAIGLGVVSGREMPDAGFAIAFMLYGATFGPVLAYRWLLSKNAVRSPLLDRVVCTGAAALCMSPGIGIASDTGPDGGRMALPILAVLMIFDWVRRIESGRHTSNDGSQAIWPAVCGLFLGSIFDAPSPWISAAMCGTVALLVPMASAAWSLGGTPHQPSGRGGAGGRFSRRGSADSANRGEYADDPSFVFRAEIGRGGEPRSVPPAPPAIPPAAAQIEVAQPSFVGRTANAGLALIGKVLLLGGVVLALTYYGRPVELPWPGETQVRYHEGAVSVAEQNHDGVVSQYEGGRVAVAEQGWERVSPRVPQPILFIPIAIGTAVLVFARRRDGGAHMARALLACVFGVAAAVLALGPGAGAIEALGEGNLRGLAGRGVVMLVFGASCVFMSLVLLFWPKSSGQRTIVL